MDGRAFLVVARDTLRGSTEAHWRTTAGRAYYALMLELRDTYVSWGLSPPTRGNVHQYVHHRGYATKDADMHQITQTADTLRDLRRQADYDLGPNPEFATPVRATDAVRLAEWAITLLDAIKADARRRSTIAAEIRAVFP
jgi:hypothetical protein